jgi:hypothetical protein
VQALHQCLRSTNSEERALAAYILVKCGRHLPSEAHAALQASPDPRERFAALYHTLRFGPEREALWEHIAHEQAASVRQDIIFEMLKRESFRSDPRMIHALVGEVDPVEGMPMWAADVLSRLVPGGPGSAEALTGPPPRVQDRDWREDVALRWRHWFQENGARLRWDESARVFRVEG